MAKTKPHRRVTKAAAKKAARAPKKAKPTADLPGQMTGAELNGFPVMRIRAGDLQGADYNPRDIDQDSLRGLQASVDEFGMPQPIIWNKRTQRLIGGHQRLKTLGPDDETDVIVMDLTEVREKALNVALNNPNIQGSWTESITDLLQEIEVAVPDLTSVLRFDTLLDDITSSIDSDLNGGGEGPVLSENYTRKIETPIYEPHGDKPDESELYDREKTDALIDDIDECEDLPEEVRDFLINAAERHTVFRFDRIAEYYAHAPAKVQDLMEQSACVIIDFERAIELGYVKLTESMLKQAGIVKREGDA